MRITGGEFRGRVLARPRDARTRPTSGRVREAWMSIVGPLLPDARVLDLYAASGALGLEALSRGAAAATFVDVSPAAIAALRENVARLGVADRAAVRRGDALRVAAALPPGAFDLAFADPPYGHGHAARLVDLFRAVPFARLLVVEHRADEAVPGDETRRYGDTALTLCHAP